MPSKLNYTETLSQTSFERGAERLLYFLIFSTHKTMT